MSQPGGRPNATYEITLSALKSQAPTTLYLPTIVKLAWPEVFSNHLGAIDLMMSEKKPL